MKKYKVKVDCFCEGYLNEITRHWREGIKERKLFKDDIVEFVREWKNLFGMYFTVRKDGVEYDIPPSKLILLPADQPKEIANEPNYQL